MRVRTRRFLAEEQARPASVGKLRLDVRQRSGATVPTADVTVTITGSSTVELGDIVVHESRPGWITLDLPPLEKWREPLKWLTPPQRERVQSPEFYALLQDRIGQRFLAQRE